jgi:hypothetical protein
MDLKKENRMKSFNTFLLEKTFRIGSDVDFLYNRVYKKYVNQLLKYDGSGRFPDKPNKQYITSDKLKSKDAKKAHEVNPITIEFFTSDENAYIPLKHKIVLNINPRVIEMIKDSDGIIPASNLLSSNQKMQFQDDVSERRIKATIYYELSHWIDDSLHNFHITKMIKDVVKNPDETKKIINQDGKTSLSSYYEINAQIHALKQYKRSIKKDKWDTMTFKDIETYFTSPSYVADTLATRYGKKEYKRWKKEILKRMARENLLGKNMKNKRG